MGTAAGIINGALRKLGVIAGGEDASSADQADGLTALNEMIESFSTESLYIYGDNEETFVLTSGKASYTMGVGGDFNTVRPIKVTHVRLKVNSSTPAYETVISNLVLDEWVRIVQKNISSTLPQAIYINYADPLATVNVYPIPSAAQSLILNSMKLVSSYSSAGTTITLPPGYKRLLTFNLAVEVAPEYGIEPSPTVRRIAAESKANILRINTRMPIARNEVADLINGAPFNWLTGQ